CSKAPPPPPLTTTRTTFASATTGPKPPPADSRRYNFAIATFDSETLSECEDLFFAGSGDAGTDVDATRVAVVKARYLKNEDPASTKVLLTENANVTAPE